MRHLQHSRWNTLHFDISSLAFMLCWFWPLIWFLAFKTITALTQSVKSHVVTVLTLVFWFCRCRTWSSLCWWLLLLASSLMKRLLEVSEMSLTLCSLGFSFDSMQHCPLRSFHAQSNWNPFLLRGDCSVPPWHYLLLLQPHTCLACLITLVTIFLLFMFSSQVYVQTRQSKTW